MQVNILLLFFFQTSVKTDGSWLPNTTGPLPVFTSLVSGHNVMVDWWLCPFLSPNDVEKATHAFLASQTDE